MEMLDEGGSNPMGHWAPRCCITAPPPPSPRGRTSSRRVGVSRDSAPTTACPRQRVARACEGVRGHCGIRQCQACTAVEGAHGGNNLTSSAGPPLILNIRFCSSSSSPLFFTALFPTRPSSVRVHISPWRRQLFFHCLFGLILLFSSLAAPSFSPPASHVDVSSAVSCQASVGAHSLTRPRRRFSAIRLHNERPLHRLSTCFHAEDRRLDKLGQSKRSSSFDTRLHGFGRRLSFLKSSTARSCLSLARTPSAAVGQATDGAMAQRTARGRKGGDVCVIFVHAGAGYHSVQNEGLHLQACNDAAKAGMAMLRNGGTAVDAVEIAIKILEDREITNAGYGSNLAMDGVVECDAIVVDHYGRSGGVGAVAQIKNPISLARLILDHTTKPLLLKRVPPNLLVAQGATDFAFEQGMSILPHDALVSPAARDRWLKWRADLRCAERRARRALPSPISQASYTSEELCPFHEEQVRKKMRENHTKAMLRGFVDVDESMVAPKPTPQQPTSSPVSNNMSDASATSQLASNSSMASLLDADRLDSSRPASFAEATHNPLINSTQTVPTLSSLHSAQDLDRSQTPDVEMSDIDDDIDFAVYHAGDRRLQRSQAWHDGGLEDESDSSSDTLRLPSLTPSPAPLEAVQKPLPETPQDDLSNLARTTTNLHHVVEKAPLPPEPSQVRLQEPSQQQRQEKREDHITDTVGVVAVDCYGHIACGASSGGIGMKYRGRIGPAALVGVGAAVMPMDPDDRDKVSVATVTSGTGEHMATTMAAMVGSERLYHSMKRDKDGNVTAVNEEEAIRSMIDKDFMGHSSVKNSNSAGAIGVLSVKKTRDGVYLYFAHNTDSFALASMHSDEDRPTCTMSRSTGNSSIAQGGRAIRYRRKQR